MYDKFDESEYYGETDARVAARQARWDEICEEEARAERARFLAREEAECAFFDAMTLEEDRAYNAFDEETRAALLEAAVALPLGAVTCWVNSLGLARVAMKEAA